MIRKLSLAALLFATAASAKESVNRFDVDDFSMIDLTGADRVRVVPGPAVSVVASGEQRALDALDIGVRGETLRIGRRPGQWHDRGALITVTMPTLRGATISGSGGITAEGVTGSSFTGRISGSGGLRLPGLGVRSARFDLAGSGSIVAAGRAETVEIDLGGSGSVDTRALQTSAVRIALAGSGSVDAAASGVATIRAGGSGSVRVSGGARCDLSKTGSGAVRCS